MTFSHGPDAGTSPAGHQGRPASPPLAASAFGGLRRHFPVKPVLFVRQRQPSFSHSGVSPDAGVVRFFIGDLQAVVGVLAECVGVFHPTEIWSSLRLQCRFRKVQAGSDNLTKAQAIWNDLPLDGLARNAKPEFGWVFMTRVLAMLVLLLVLSDHRQKVESLR